MHESCQLLYWYLCRKIWYIYGGLLWFDSNIHYVSGTLKGEQKMTGKIYENKLL